MRKIEFITILFILSTFNSFALWGNDFDFGPTLITADNKNDKVRPSSNSGKSIFVEVSSGYGAIQISGDPAKTLFENPINHTLSKTNTRILKAYSYNRTDESAYACIKKIKDDSYFCRLYINR